MSVVFATEEYRELLEPAAKKCGALFYLLPSVASLDNDLSDKQEHGLQSIEKMEAEIHKVSSRIRGISERRLIRIVCEDLSDELYGPL